MPLNFHTRFSSGEGRKGLQPSKNSK